MTDRIGGVLAPVVTPFTSDLSPDPDRLASHCRWLVANGVGLAVFGTNSEANSLSVGEKLDLLSRLIESGVDPGRMMPGTGACSLVDAAELTAHAVGLGCAGVLMLPPFYYKGVPDEGLFRYYAEVIERVADRRLRIYLYHIPPVSQVPIPHALIDRLLDRYPETIAGIKDSSGEWSNTSAMLERFAGRGFDVFTGSETWLLANLRGGGRGCISATANVNPAAIHALYEHWRADDAEERQQSLDRIRTIFQKAPMIAALKHAVAHWSGDEGWDRVRPPLVELSPTQRNALVDDLERAGFDMPGLRNEDARPR